MEMLLEVKNLSTHFTTRDFTAMAVDDISFSLAPSETFGLVGESGCGKSATCRSILQILRKPGKIVGGEIFYKGKDLLKMSEAELRRVRGSEIGMIFQEPMTSLNPVLKIKEQIFENIKDQALDKKGRYDRAMELLKMVGIPMPEVRLNEYIHQYSGGMRQRAMIAIALAAQPKILLADEPTTALDVTIQDQILKLLNHLKAQFNMSVILVTHDLGIVAQMCDRVAVMYAGRIVEMTDTDTLLTKPGHPYTDALLRSVPTGGAAQRRLFSIKGAPPDLTQLPPGCAFAPRCALCIQRCKEEKPVLSEIEAGQWVACHCPEKLRQEGY